MSKSVPCIHVDRLSWSKPEDSPNPEALAAKADEYEFELAPNPEKSKVWDWVTKRGSEIVGFGEAKSQSGAQRAAANVANAERRLRAKAKVTTEGMPELAEFPEEPEGPNAGDMFDSTEKAVEQAMNKKRPAVPAEPKPRKAPRAKKGQQTAKVAA